MSNRTERRRQKAEFRRRRAKWETGILAFHEQAGGAFGARLFRLNGAPPPPGAGSAIANWCLTAVAHRDVCCIGCEATFGRDGWPEAFLIIAPCGHAAETGLVCGICHSCAAQSDAAVYEVGRRQMEHIWPSLREVPIAHLHATGGQA